jgi:glycerol-3-phosphate acyltransferase PlsX
MGALFLKKDIYGIKDFMDYNNYGGAVMLGLKKIVIKGHGSGNELRSTIASNKPITPAKTS